MKKKKKQHADDHSRLLIAIVEMLISLITLILQLLKIILED